MKNKQNRRYFAGCRRPSTMKIIFYHSALCPRCLLVGRTLRKLQKQYPDLEVEKIEVTTSPLASLRQGVRMIPTLSAAGRKLSGIFLTPAAVRSFVDTLYRRSSAV